MSSVCLRIALLAALAACAAGFSPVVGRPAQPLARAHAASAFAPAPAYVTARPAAAVAQPQMSLFGLGWPELLVIGGAALLFFGPEKLTDVAKEAGKSASALKDASAAFQEGMQEAEQDNKQESLQAADEKKKDA